MWLNIQSKACTLCFCPLCFLPSLHWCMLIVLGIYAWCVLLAPPLPASRFSGFPKLRKETPSPFHHGPDSSDTSGAVSSETWLFIQPASAPLGIGISLSWVQLSRRRHPQHLSVETLFPGYPSFFEIQYLSLFSLCIVFLPRKSWAFPKETRNFIKHKPRKVLRRILTKLVCSPLPKENVRIVFL